MIGGFECGALGMITDRENPKVSKKTCSGASLFATNLTRFALGQILCPSQ
jgi:hypothetical protein